eukprot:m.490680 g.490680  ORF g.490680 m.490680 type:complete len:1184 (+) comp28474_c0_seq1:274-3825(+)
MGTYKDHQTDEEYHRVPVKFMGHVPVSAHKETPTTATLCQDVLSTLLRQPSRREYRKGFSKDMLISLSASRGLLYATPKDGGRSLSIPLATIEGVAVAPASNNSDKFAFVTESANGSQRVVYAFQFRRKQDVSGFLDALKAATLESQEKRASASAGEGDADVATATADGVDERLKPSGIVRNAQQSASTKSNVSAKVANIMSSLEGAASSTPESQVRQLQERVQELEKQVVIERGNASAAEVARLSSVLRWVSAEKEAAELKTEITEMRAEMAGVAAEMAADMAQMKQESQDLRTDRLMREIRSVKRGLAIIHKAAPSEASASGSQTDLWDRVRLVEAREGTGSKESLDVGSPNASMVRQQSKLLSLVKRQSNINVESSLEALGDPDSAIRTHTTDAASSADDKSRMLDAEVDQALQSADKPSLVAIIQEQRLQLKEIDNLKKQFLQLQSQLDESETRSNQLVKELEAMQSENDAQRSAFELEKRLLADTIAGQQGDAAAVLATNRAAALSAKPALADETFADLTNEEEVVEEIEFVKGVNGLGFSIAGGTDDRVEESDTAIYVTNVLPGGAADQDGRLCIGDRILKVNGVSVINVTHDQAVRALLQPAGNVCRLTVSRLPEHQEIEEINFPRGPKGLGFSIAGGIDHPVEEDDNSVYVTSVIEGGAAALDGRLRVGDKLLTVNGQNVENVTHVEVVNALQTTRDDVFLTVVRFADGGMGEPDEEEEDDEPDPVEDIIVIEFNRGAQGLGFSIRGGIDHPVDDDDASIYITHIIEGGAAAHDGRLHVGDRLVEVNGVNVLNVLHEEAVKALQLNRTGVKLVIARLPPPLEETEMIVFEKGAGGLGFSIAGGTDDMEDGDAGIYVTQIIENSSAARDGRLRGGDKILQVNGHSLDMVTHDEAVKLLQQDDTQVQLFVSRLVDPPSSIIQEMFIDIAFKRGPNGGLGFSIAGGKDDCVEEGDEGIYITSVTPGGAARLDGRLLFGDKLVEVNGVDVTSVSHAEAVAALQRDTEGVTMTISRIDREVIEHIQFDKGSDGLGFSIAGGTDDPVEEGDVSVFVTNVIENGAADRDGRLQLGDKLLTVNGKDVTHVTHAEAVATLQSNPTGVTMTISRLPPEMMVDDAMEEEGMLGEEGENEFQDALTSPNVTQGPNDSELGYIEVQHDKSDIAVEGMDDSHAELNGSA